MRDTKDAETHDYDSDGVLLSQLMILNSTPGIVANSIRTQFGKEDLQASHRHATCRVRYVDGSEKEVAFNNFKDAYADGYTGETLDHTLTKEAIMNEVRWFSGKVWRITTIDEARADSVGKIIGGDG